MSEVKKQQTGIDFGTIEKPKNADYLQPGHYYLTISDAKYVKGEGNKPDGTPKSSYIEVEFTGEAGIVKEKFFISVKAAPRLKYFHEAWFDKEFSKPFESEEAIGLYFTKVLTMKSIKKGVCVGGRQMPDGKIYGGLPYSNFILPEGMNFEEGRFEVNSANFKQYVKVEVNASSNTSDVMLPTSNNIAKAENKEDWDQLPF